MSIWGRGTGNAGEWKALIRGKGEKDGKPCRFIPASSFIPVFPLSIAANLYASNYI